MVFLFGFPAKQSQLYFKFDWTNVFGLDGAKDLELFQGVTYSNYNIVPAYRYSRLAMDRMPPKHSLESWNGTLFK